MRRCHTSTCHDELATIPNPPFDALSEQVAASGVDDPREDSLLIESHLSSSFPSQRDQVFSRVVTVIQSFQFLTHLTPDAPGLEPAAQHHQGTEVARAEIHRL